MNIDLAKKVYAHITAHPDQFDMDQFADVAPDSECGTSACIAGWAQVLSGQFKIVVKPMLDNDGNPVVRHGHPVQYADFERVAGQPTPDDEDNHDMGRELLGITDDQAHELFYTDSNAEAVQLLHHLIDEAQAQQDSAATNHDNTERGVQK